MTPTGDVESEEAARGITVCQGRYETMRQILNLQSRDSDVKIYGTGRSSGECVGQTSPSFQSKHENSAKGFLAFIIKRGIVLQQRRQ